MSKKKTGKFGEKNPYVHPKTLSDGRVMLNRAGNDGFSFDEMDDDPYDGFDNASPNDDEKLSNRRAAEAADYLNLSQEDATNMSDKALCDSYDAYANEKDLKEFE